MTSTHSAHSSGPPSGSCSSDNSMVAQRALQQELKRLAKEPVEGFVVQPDERDMFKWSVGIFGPPGTLYQGGYFKAQIKFPNNYPFSPPSMRFLSKMWHPNVYESGELCISILHPPVDDPHSGEHLNERWNPSQSVRTILLSVISLLNEPNTMSPANVDASVMFRRWREQGDEAYVKRVRQQVEDSKAVATKDKVEVPETVEAYCIKHNPHQYEDELIDLDEDYYGQSSSEEEEEEESESESESEEELEGNDEDSGQGEN